MNVITVYGDMHPHKLVDLGLAPADLVILNDAYFRLQEVSGLKMLIPWNPLKDSAYMYDLLTSLPFTLESYRGEWQLTLGTWTEHIKSLEALPAKVLHMAVAYCGS